MLILIADILNLLGRGSEAPLKHIASTHTHMHTAHVHKGISKRGLHEVRERETQTHEEDEYSRMSGKGNSREETKANSNAEREKNKQQRDAVRLFTGEKIATERQKGNVTETRVSSGSERAERKPESETGDLRNIRKERGQQILRVHQDKKPSRHSKKRTKQPKACDPKEEKRKKASRHHLGERRATATKHTLERYI